MAALFVAIAIKGGIFAWWERFKARPIPMHLRSGVYVQSNLVRNVQRAGLIWGVAYASFLVLMFGFLFYVRHRS